MVDKERKKAIVIDIANSNIRMKEHEKLEEYQGLREELENMWRVKDTVLPNWRTSGSDSPNLASSCSVKKND